nr:hypothetical protein [Halomonas elongata]
MRLMGGPNTPRREQPIKPWRVTRMDTGRDEFSHATGEVAQGLEARGRYGESIKTTWGLVVNDGRGRQAEYLTRLFRWEIRPRHQRAEGQGAGASGDPWTCVNNCTGVDITPRQPSPEVLAEQVQRFENGARAMRFAPLRKTRPSRPERFAPPPGGYSNHHRHPRRKNTSRRSCADNNQEDDMRRKRIHQAAPRGTLQDAGELAVLTENSGQVRHQHALVIAFDSEDELRRAVKDHACRYRDSQHVQEIKANG